jgi:hypothetical protein
VCILGTGVRYAQDAADTVFSETKASTILQKYVVLKDMHSALAAKQASITVYAARLSELEEAYGAQPRNLWDRTDKELHSQWVTEVAGLKASFNSLAAQYNAAMAKINWRFCNVGDLPQGATEPLPREYVSYIAQ